MRIPMPPWLEALAGERVWAGYWHTAGIFPAPIMVVGADGKRRRPKSSVPVSLLTRVEAEALARAAAPAQRRKLGKDRRISFTFGTMLAMGAPLADGGCLGVVTINDAYVPRRRGPSNDDCADEYRDEVIEALVELDTVALAWGDYLGLLFVYTKRDLSRLQAIVPRPGFSLVLDTGHAWFSLSIDGQPTNVEMLRDLHPHRAARAVVNKDLWGFFLVENGRPIAPAELHTLRLVSVEQVTAAIGADPAPVPAEQSQPPAPAATAKFGFTRGEVCSAISAV
jgi:hypothetical protein